MPNKAMLSAREKFLAGFEKNYGKGTISSRTKNEYDAISTGSIALDRAMSSGGYLIGRETELWGPPDGGKSSLALIAAGEAQRKFPDREVIFVDVEHKYDPVWAAALGADPSRILLVDPLTAENTADMVKDSITSDLASLVIVDSIGAVLTAKEFEKDAGESDMGKRSQVVSRMILIAVGLAPRHNLAVLVINQARSNFGYGADTKPSGGFVPAHSSTHKLQVKRASSSYTMGTKDTQVNIGYEMGVRVERNKVGPSGRNVKFDFYTYPTSAHPVGIDRVQEAFIIGARDGLIETSGSYYTFEDGEKVQGKESAMDYLLKNPKLVDSIRTKIVNTQRELEFDPDEVPQLSDEAKKELVS